MYIKKVKISHIRAINQLTLKFDKPAGWHVLIGDNGAGKSAIVKSIALALLDTTNMSGITFDWNDWLSRKAKEGSIELTIQPDSRFEGTITDEKLINKLIFDRIDDPTYPAAKIKGFTYRNIEAVRTEAQSTITTTPTVPEPSAYATSTPTPPPTALKQNVWFSVAYGPLRRFKGGDQFAEEDLYKRYPRLGAHLTVFKEDYALSQADKYIRDLFVSGKADENPDASRAIEGIRHFFNYSGLLPHQTTLGGISSKEIFFVDGNKNPIKIAEMSDGYRSILSLMFELIRQLIFSYGVDLVFANVQQPNPTIDLPGVVLIDEIDAHLHPTWQTKIGQWFTQYFPQIQFIVTTHSPLICRAAENGTIWQLPTPGSDETLQEITGVKRKRLIFGNVLDAYGTGVFGQKTAISEDANDKRNELAALNVKSMLGQISEQEEQQLNKLRSIFPTKG